MRREKFDPILSIAPTPQGTLAVTINTREKDNVAYVAAMINDITDTVAVAYKVKREDVWKLVEEEHNNPTRDSLRTVQ